MKKESIYGRTLAPKLKELVALSRSPSSPLERLSLTDEVEMMRILAARQVDALLPNALDGETPELRLAAAELAKKNLTDVATLVDKAAKVRSLATDAATVDDIEFVMNQVIGIIQSVVHPLDPILAQTITTQIENIKMPSRDRDMPTANQLLAAAAKEIARIENGTST